MIGFNQLPFQPRDLLENLGDKGDYIRQLQQLQRAPQGNSAVSSPVPAPTGGGGSPPPPPVPAPTGMRTQSQFPNGSFPLQPRNNSFMNGPIAAAIGGMGNGIIPGMFRGVQRHGAIQNAQALKEQELLQKQQREQRTRAGMNRTAEQAVRLGMPESEAYAYVDIGAPGIKALVDFINSKRAAPKTTDDITEFRMSQENPAFRDYMKEIKQAGSQRININTEGQIPKDHTAVRDEGGRLLRYEVIPNSPTARKMEADRLKLSEAQEKQQSQEDVKAETQATKVNTMRGAVQGILDIAGDSKTPFAGTNSIPFALHSDTAAGQIRAHARTLTSGVALQALVRLKEASSTGSTGFGAMNREELQLLIDDMGVLDPNVSEDIFIATVKRISDRLDRVSEDIRKNVSPERMKELGLDTVLGGNKEKTDDELFEQYRAK